MAVDLRPSVAAVPGAAIPTQVVTSSDGTLAAVIDAERVTVLDLPGLGQRSEIGIDRDAGACDIALVGAPSRLVVLARYATHTVLHLIEPIAPVQLGELRVESVVGLLAVSGDHLLVGNASSCAVIDCSRKDLVVAPLLSRVAVAAAGAYTEGRFVLSSSGIVEEYDAETRSPIRRFRLGRSVLARHVGGSERQAWLLPQPDAVMVEIIPLINRGQPQLVVLPEPAFRVIADPRLDALLVIGVSRALYAVDLVTRRGVSVVEGVQCDSAALLIGRQVAALVVSAGSAPRLISLAKLIPTGTPAPSDDELDDTLGDDDGAPTTTAVPIAVASSPYIDTIPVAERLLAWRERMRASMPSPEAAASETGRIGVDGRVTWRDELASWARTVMAGTADDAPPVEPSRLTAIAARFGLDGALGHGLALVYGAHLCGLDGVAAVDLARVLGRQWDEALGRGRLGASGALRWKGSRIRLIAEVRAAIDEQAPRRGALVGAGDAALLETAAVLAPRDVPLAEVAAWVTPRVGALLVPDRRAEGRLGRVVVEARARGVTPLLPWSVGAGAPPTSIALLVIEHEADAAALEVAVLDEWPS